jgi:hypothetical protein
LLFFSLPLPLPDAYLRGSSRDTLPSLFLLLELAASGQLELAEQLNAALAVTAGDPPGAAPQREVDGEVAGLAVRDELLL